MDKPIVSVVMPLYNKYAYVQRAIDSVLAQTLKEWELVIVDDGSTDGSERQIPKNDPRIRYYRQSNAGPSAARNRGVRLAKGRYVSFLDADDYYYPDKLATDIELLTTYDAYEWVLSARHNKIKSDISRHIFTSLYDEKVRSKIAFFEDAFRDLTLSGIPPTGLCMCKSLFYRVGGYNENIRFLEITEFKVRCALMQPRVIVYTVPLYRIVKTPKSASSIHIHRVKGLRQLGESYLQLSNLYPAYSNSLLFLCKINFLYYASLLIESGLASNAKFFLLNEFPLSKNIKYWLLLLLSMQPGPVISALFSIYKKTKMISNR